MGLAPDWPHLSYCLSIQNRTHAYLDKGKALVLSKLERATAMRPLSELRVSGWILNVAWPQSFSTPWRESGSLYPYVGYAASQTEGSP